LRRNAPYELYGSFDFLVPIGVVGDCFDRYLIRVQEMEQSALLILVCLNGISKGSVRTDNGKFIPPLRTAMKSSMEALIHHFKLYSEGYSVPSGSAYVSVEAPKGEFGVYISADGSSTPYRCRIRSPGFFHLGGLTALVSEHYVADVVTVIGTQDIVFGEVDR
jgi:NADH:ubiquinone oxidoreductase subunit D